MNHHQKRKLSMLIRNLHNLIIMLRLSLKSIIQQNAKKNAKKNATKNATKNACKDLSRLRMSKGNTISRIHWIAWAMVASHGSDQLSGLHVLTMPIAYNIRLSIPQEHNVKETTRKIYPWIFSSVSNKFIIQRHSVIDTSDRQIKSEDRPDHPLLIAKINPNPQIMSNNTTLRTRHKKYRSI